MYNRTAKHRNPLDTALLSWFNRRELTCCAAIMPAPRKGVPLAEGRQRESGVPYDDRKLFALVLDTLGALVVILDSKGRIVHCNNACKEVTGYSSEEMEGKPIWDLLVLPEEREKVKRVFSELVRTAAPNRHENYWRSKDGSLRLISWSNTVYRDPTGEVEYVIGTGIEVTEYRRVQERLEETNRKIEQLHETAHLLEGCAREEEVYKITIHAAEEILDFSLCTIDIVEGDALVPKATSSGLPSGASRSVSLSEETLATKTYHTGKTYVFGSPDEEPAARPTRSDFRSGISAPIGKFGVFQAVSTEEDAFSEQDVRLVELLLGHTTQAIARIRLQNELKEQAVRDPLTGVYNRRYFNEVVEQELIRSRRYDHPIGFLMIDIDRFKEINDRFGHQTGDRVLQAVADLLVAQVRESDIVVRYGGDEFLVMLIETDGQMDAVVRRIQAAVAEQNRTNELIPFPVSLAIGAAHWDPKGDQPIEKVLSAADRRMYRMKGAELEDRDSSGTAWGDGARQTGADHG